MNTIATTIRFTGAVLLASAFALPAQAITMHGDQLTTVETRADLGGNVKHCDPNASGACTNANQVYNGNAFGTFVAINNGSTQATWPLYGPTGLAAGSGATGAAGYVRWTATGTPSSTGTGTAADPFVLTTEVDAGTTGLHLKQVDRLVQTEELYTTELTLTNNSAAPIELILYRAMDCYLGGNDTGYGMVAGGTVGCVKRDANGVNSAANPISRVEQFIDLTGGAKKGLAQYGVNWGVIGQRKEYDDQCHAFNASAPSDPCNDYFDNGMGMSWRITIPASSSQTIQHATVFSPTGKLPVTTSATANPASAPQAGTVTYTLTLNNANAVPVDLQTLNFALPAGFSYVAGSSTGPFAQPAFSSNTVTWTGPVSLPPGSTTVTLQAQVGATVPVATYTSDVNGTAAGGYTVVGANATAPVSVTALTLVPMVLDATVNPGTVAAGGSPVEYTLTLANANPVAVDAQTVTVTLPAGFSFVPGSAKNVKSVMGQPAVSGDTLTWTGPTTTPASGQLSLGFSANVASTVAPGTYTIDVAGTAVGNSITGQAGVAPLNVTAAPVGPGPGPGPGGSVTSVPVDDPLALLAAAGALCAFAVRRRRQRVHTAH